MNCQTNRRHFLKTSIVSGLTFTAWPAWAIEPFQRSGPSRLQLSLAAYSFRQYFNPKESARRITLFDFIDFCAEHGCAGAELTSYYLTEPANPDYLLGLKRHAFLRGVTISGTAVSNNFALPRSPRRDAQIQAVKQWVDRAAILGAPHIRVFAGPESGLPKAEAQKLCAEALEECAAHAATKGIFLGLENHGGIVAEPDDLLAIVRMVKSPWFGINLDTGNFRTDDPYADLARCAPYAVNVQVKSEIQRRGERQKQPADLGRLVKILREANYQGFVALEYEAKEDPWTAVPELLNKLRQEIRG